MIQKLLREVIDVCMFIALGVVNWIAATLVSEWWAAIFFMLAALFDLFMAWISYRQAKSIAKALDVMYESMHKQLGFHLQLFKIIFPDKKANPEVQHNDSEDFGHPV